MRIPSLSRHSILPAASLVVALHAGTVLGQVGCPGFPDTTENCALVRTAVGLQSVGTAADHLALTFTFGSLVPGGRFFGGGNLAPWDDPLWFKRLDRQNLDSLRRKLDDAEKAYQDARDEFWRNWVEARERVRALFAALAAARRALEQQRLDDPDAQAEIAFREHAIEELSDELNDNQNQMSLGSEQYRAVLELEQARDDARAAYLEAGGELGGLETAAAEIFGEDASPDTPPPPPPAADEPSDIEGVIPELAPLIGER